MSQSADSIVAYLELLHSQRHLIAAAYCDGGVLMHEGNQRQIHKLQQNRVLLPYYQNDYRLSVSLLNHFNEVFQRQRSYAVGANFAELINRLPQLINEYQSACYENRLDDQDEYAEEFDAGVFELAALVSNELLSLRVITENQFANVRTLAEKQRQNEFYLDRAEKIGEAIAMLAAESLHNALDNSTLLKPLLLVYQRQIVARLQEWRATHLDITAVLKAFLYRLRRVEPEARRLRAFAHYLRQHPDYQTPEADDVAQLPDWSSRFAGLKLKSHPDLSNSTAREALVDVASSIPHAAVSFVKVRQAGRLLDDQQQVVNVMSPKPVQLALHRYLSAAKQAHTPLSALHWKREQAEFSAMNDEVWLLYVAYAVQLLGKSKLQCLQVRRMEAPVSYARSGNVGVQDLAVWQGV